MNRLNIINHNSTSRDINTYVWYIVHKYSKITFTHQLVQFRLFGLGQLRVGLSDAHSLLEAVYEGLGAALVLDEEGAVALCERAREQVVEDVRGLDQVVQVVAREARLVELGEQVRQELAVLRLVEQLLLHLAHALAELERRVHQQQWLPARVARLQPVHKAEQLFVGCQHRLHARTPLASCNFNSMQYPYEYI